MEGHVEEVPLDDLRGFEHPQQLEHSKQLHHAEEDCSARQGGGGSWIGERGSGIVTPRVLLVECEDEEGQDRDEIDGEPVDGIEPLAVRC